MFRFISHASRKSSQNISCYRKIFTNHACRSKNVKRFRNDGKIEVMKNLPLLPLGALGLSGIGIFIYAYHNNDEFRKQLLQYVSSDIQKKLDDLIGPEAFKYIYALEDKKTKTDPGLPKNKLQQVTPPMNKTSQKATPESTETRFKNILIDLNLKNKSVETVFNEYETHLKNYGDKLKNTVENMEVTNDMKSEESYWQSLHNAVYERNYAKNRVEKEIGDLKRQLSTYESEINGIKSNPEMNSNTQILDLVAEIDTEIKNCHNQLDEKKEQLLELDKSAKFQDNYSRKVGSARQQIIREIEGLGYDFGKEIKENDILLILHAHKRLMQLTARIAEIEANFEPNLKLLVDEELSKVEERVRKEMESKQQVIVDQQVSEELAKLEAAQVNQVAKLLKLQRDEFDREQDLKIKAALLKEKDRLNVEIEQWNERVQGLEAAVEGRANQERQIKEARELWISGRILHNLLYRIDNPPISPPLGKYVLSLEEAACPGSSRSRVQELCRCIPKRVKEEGVVTFRSLVERWDTVYSVGRKVSMVPETGAGIMGYVLSWFRSKLLLKPTLLLDSDTEIASVDPSKFDPNLILESVNKAMACQNLGLAVRLLTLLDGMPRVIAEDWIKDTVDFLETSHIIDAVESYTASRTVGVAEEQQQQQQQKQQFDLNAKEISNASFTIGNSNSMDIYSILSNTNNEDNKSTPDQNDVQPKECSDGQCNR